MSGSSPTGIPERFSAIEQDWRPDEQVAEDVVAVRPAATFAALLDQESPVAEDGDVLPPLWHWFLFPPLHRRSEMGDDGHPRDASFTPPLPERRRMFGGGRLQVEAPLRCGEVVQRRSRLASVRTRMGRTGPLLLVTVRHEFSVDDMLRAVEEQDIVYRQADDVRAAPSPAKPDTPSSSDGVGADGDAAWRLSVEPDPVTLFRFSALTSNAHRIHYDHPYTTEVEGHPGLIVHGPLLALALLELPRRFAWDREVASFSWRARRTLFGEDEVTARGYPGGDLSSVELTVGTASVRDAVAGSVILREAS